MQILARPRDRDVTFAEAGEATPLSSTFGESLSRQGDVIRAAYRATSYGDNSNSRALALEAGYDRIIERAQTATGIVLENPERDGYGEEAATLFRQEARAAIASGTLAQSNGVPDVRRKLFAQRLQALAEANPDKAESLLLDPEAEARAATRASQANLARAVEKADAPVASFVSGLAGGIGASFRDPLQVASLFVGGGVGTAGSALLRVGQVAAREALINAGTTALAQPAVQKWREEAGLESGLKPALENVGMAALFGAIVGSAIEGGREGWKALRGADRLNVEKTVAGTATPAEAEAALRALNVDKETVDAFAAGRRAADADVAAGAEPPAGANPVAHGEALSEAIVRAETGEVLAQEPVFPVRTGATDDKALAVLEREDLDAIGALEELRSNPDLVESALASSSPAVREAGHVAMLGDEAFDIVASGRVDPRHAALVLRAAAEPDRQAAIMRDLAELAPGSIEEAKAVIGDALAAETARSTAARIMGEAVPFDPAAPERGLSLPVEEGAAAPAAPAPARAEAGGAPPSDPLQGVPGDGGTVAPRGAAEVAGARDEWLTDVVKACKD